MRELTKSQESVREKSSQGKLFVFGATPVFIRLLQALCYQFQGFCCILTTTTITTILLRPFNGLFFQVVLGKPAPERQAILDFTGARDDGVAVAY